MSETTNGLRAGWVEIPLGDLEPGRSESVDPRKTPGELFDIYSVPAFPGGHPETLRGSAIGSSKQRVEPGTILLCGINPRINRVWVVGEKGRNRQIASTEWIAFSPTPGVSGKYLSYFLQQDRIRDFLARNASGVGGSLMRVKGRNCSEIGLPLAPIREQKRIVAEIEKQFTRLDAAVAALKRVQANLKRYRASVLKAACEGRLVPTEAELARREGRSYEHASELLKRILAERRSSGKPMGKRERALLDETNRPNPNQLPTVPEGWEWVNMPLLGELNRGKSKHRPRDDARLFGGAYPFIQTGDVKRSRGHIRAHSQTYSEYGLAQSRLWPEGTLCITIAANIAESGILTYPACFPDSVVGFSMPDHPEIVRFVRFFLETAKSDLSRFAPATAQKNINLEILSDLAVPLPPFSEQCRIVAEVERRISIIDELEMGVETDFKRAERLRQAILKRAFEGKLVPQDPNDEPAGVLLERIRAEREDSDRGSSVKKSEKSGATKRLRPKDLSHATN